MRILHTSDWHLGKSLYDFSLLGDQRAMLDFLLDLIAREKIDTVIIAGDVYDRPVPPAEAVRLYDSFLTRAVVELGAKVVAIAGNHDSASRLEFGSNLYKSGGYHVFGSVKALEPPVVLNDSFGGVCFHPVPWLHPAEIRGLFGLDGVRTFDAAYSALLDRRLETLDTSVRNIAVAHGFFAGLGGHSDKDVITSDSEINLGGMDIADSSRFKSFDYTALGHLHAPQRAGGDKIRYSGSPLKYSLSEERQRKSFTLLELREKGNMHVESVPVPSVRDVRSVTGRFDDLMEPSFHENKSFGDYVFANITDTGVLYPMEKLRTLFPNLLGLRFTSEEQAGSLEAPRLAGGQRPTILELFARFYKDAKSADMPDDRLDFLRGLIEKSEEDFE